ncbi:MAG: hypothetical protein GC195_07875 [Nostoc sp. RI_552]|nr:hypothetical protein [Nostoc sp. RI_552]
MSDAQQEANTIILELGSRKKDDIRDLREGHGRLFKEIERAISGLRESGEIGASIQPIVVIVTQKKSD